MKMMQFSVGIFLLGASTLVNAKEIATHDGCDTAVVLKADSHMDGVSKEYDWIEDAYPGSELEKQSLVSCDKGPADKMEIRTKSGEKVIVYFDLSGFWGKGF